MSTRVTRAKRAALADISNQNDEGTVPPNEGVAKRTRRSLGLRSEADEIPPVTEPLKQVEPKATRYSSGSGNRSSSGSVLPQTNHKPAHKIRRARPLHLKNSDPAQCLDIIDDIYSIFYENQDKYAAKPYMTRQKDISSKMRSILVDWLIEVHYKYRYQPQTLWLSINILDRYLEKIQVQRSKLQLVGVTALLIASKYEEVFPFEVDECVYITDNAYERKDILEMEIIILKQIEYEVCVPTGYNFLIRYLNCIQASDRTRFLASYYAERNLQEVEMFTITPHLFAASAVYAALKQQTHQYKVLRNASSWNTILQEESGLQEVDVLAISRILIHHVGEEVETASRRRLVAAKKKYSHERYQNVSSLVLPII